MQDKPKTQCLKRLARIEGQVRGLSRMLEEDRYCIDVITQIAAVRAALRRVEEAVLEEHVTHCVEHAIRSGDPADQRQKVAELLTGPAPQRPLGRVSRPSQRKTRWPMSTAEARACAASPTRPPRG